MKKIFSKLNLDSMLLMLSLLFSLVAVGMSMYNVKFLEKQLNDKLASLPVSVSATGGVAVLPAEKFTSELKNTDPILGNPEAKLTVVEFADFQCPYCKKFFTESLKKFQDKYINPGKIKFVFYNVSFLGQESTDAGAAAKCAADQGQFWQYHDLLYENQRGENLGAFSQAKLLALAVKLKNFNQADFKTCVTSQKYNQAVTDETNLAIKYGVAATPTLLIGNKMIKGAQSFESFQQLIDKALTQVN